MFYNEVNCVFEPVLQWMRRADGKKRPTIKVKETYLVQETYYQGERDLLLK